jgi:hypothetical protein
MVQQFFFSNPEISPYSNAAACRNGSYRLK